MEWETVAGKLNSIDWSFTNELWYNILVINRANKRMITGKDSIRGAGAVISYMILGNRMTRSEVEDVRSIICNAQNDPSAKLPPLL